MQCAFDSEFSRYVAEMRPGLRNQALLLCGDWFEADDLVQETLIKLSRHWDTLDRRAELAAYTRMVMIRTFINDCTSVRRSREFPAEQIPEPDSKAGGQEQLADRLMLVEALAKLGPRQMAVVMLRYWEDFTVAEVADALSCSPSTVRSQTARALANLRSLLRHDLHP